jgi:hypothetical protein
MRCFRPDGHRAIGAVGDTPRGARGRSFNAVMAELAGFHFFERSESLDVETRAHAQLLKPIVQKFLPAHSFSGHYDRAIQDRKNLFFI